MRVKVLILSNLSTHPAIFLLFPLLFFHAHASFGQYLLFSETFAPLMEALLVWRIWAVSPKQAFPAMILANLFSWTVGAWFKG